MNLNGNLNFEFGNKEERNRKEKKKRNLHMGQILLSSAHLTPTARPKSSLPSTLTPLTGGPAPSVARPHTRRVSVCHLGPLAIFTQQHTLVFVPRTCGASVSVLVLNNLPTPARAIAVLAAGDVELVQSPRAYKRSGRIPSFPLLVAV